MNGDNKCFRGQKMIHLIFSLYIVNYVYESFSFHKLFERIEKLLNSGQGMINEEYAQKNSQANNT